MSEDWKFDCFMATNSYLLTDIFYIWARKGQIFKLTNLKNQPWITTKSGWPCQTAQPWKGSRVVPSEFIFIHYLLVELHQKVDFFIPFKKVLTYLINLLWMDSSNRIGNVRIRLRNDTGKAEVIGTFKSLVS